MANAAGEGGERRGKEERTGEAGDEIHAGRKKGRERSWKMRRGERKEESRGRGRRSVCSPQGEAALPG